MRSSLIKSCLLALATTSTVLAQTAGFDVFAEPSTPGSTIPAGSTYTIKWTPSSPEGTISIMLLEGSSNITLQAGPTIAHSIEGLVGSYDWKVPTNLPAFPYFGFQLSLDSNPKIFQYSTYFSISGLAASSSGSSGSGSTTTVASTTVTMKVSQVGPTTSSSTTTISASRVTVNSTSTTSTSAGTFPNSTMTTTTSKIGATTTASTTSASASSSSGAVGAVAVGGTGLLGALFIALGMLL